jgi:hypothetical protein
VCVCVCVYVRLFCVCVVLYLGRGLATRRSLIRGVLQIVYIFKEKMVDLDTVRVRYKRNGYKKYKYCYNSDTKEAAIDRVYTLVRVSKNA